MFKALWKLIRSDERVIEALLGQSGASYNLSPDAPAIPANNDEPQAVRDHRTKSRLWLEDWSEKDEERLRSSDHYWSGYGGKRSAKDY
jgi:hypothetical protein